MPYYGEFDVPFSRGKFTAPNTEGAFAAFGASGGAAVPSKEDDSVTKVTAFFRRQDQTELIFNFYRIFAVGQSQPAANTDAMGIAHDAARLTVEVTQQ